MTRDNSHPRAGGFKKGSVPWNKGIKGLHHSPLTEFKKGHATWNKDVKGMHLSPTTEFKKGMKSINTVPVGTITIRTDKGTTGTRRQWIKIAEPNKWIEYAKYIWLQAGKELTKGMVLHHRNKNSLFDRIENLILVTRAEHLKLHNIGEIGRAALRNKYVAIARARIGAEENQLKLPFDAA